MLHALACLTFRTHPSLAISGDRCALERHVSAQREARPPGHISPDPEAVDGGGMRTPDPAVPRHPVPEGHPLANASLYLPCIQDSDPATTLPLVPRGFVGGGTGVVRSQALHLYFGFGAPYMPVYTHLQPTARRHKRLLSLVKL